MNSTSSRQKKQENLEIYYTVMPLLLGLASVAVGVVYFSRPLLPLRSGPATQARQSEANGISKVLQVSCDKVPAYLLLETSVGPRLSRPEPGMGSPRLMSTCRRGEQKLNHPY